MSVADAIEHANKISSIWKASRPFASVFVAIDEDVPLKPVKSQTSAGGGIRIGETITIHVSTVDDVNRLRLAVNELAIAMMKSDNQS